MESTLYIEAMDCEEEAKLIRASLHHLNGLEKYEIEAAGRIRGMAFDKTGYLTLGRPVVTDIVPFGAKTEDEVLSLASSIESRSEHVLAEAILMRAREEGVAVRDVGGG